MKRMASGLGAVALATGAVVALPVTAVAAPISLSLLNINDFHGRIDANTVAVAGTVEQQRAEIEAAGGEALFLSAGDNIGASLFASSSQQDQPTIDVLNALDLAATAVGNHEFDQGYDDLVDRVIDGGANAQFAHLGANVYLTGTTTPALDEYAIFTVNGITVAVIGAVTEETSTLVSPGGISGLDFGDPVEAVNRVAAQLSDGDPANGEADIIVAEYHEGAADGSSTLEEQVAATDAFAAIVNDTVAEVDVIFTAHTHQAYVWDGPVPGEPERTRPIVQTGSYGANVGRVDLVFDDEEGGIVSYSGQNVARTSTAAADLIAAYPRVAEVNDIVTAALAVADEIGSRPVGSVTADITTAFVGGTWADGVYVGSGPEATTGRDDRASESALGALVADALVDSLSADERGGATIGVVNPGGLRAELLYGEDGVITYAEANAVLPFVNNLWTTTLTGAQFKDLLEEQWQLDADGNVPSRAYLQLGLSENVTYTFDAERAQGDRITSITIDGQPYDPAAPYRIGTFSFLVEGGDNFRAFLGGTDARDSGLIDRDAWIAYIEGSSPLSPDFARQSVSVPELPELVTAGEDLTFPVGSLDLTSLGSPLNTSLTVWLGEIELGAFTVTEGAAEVSVTIPEGTPTGLHQLTLVATPSGTTVSLEIAVEAVVVPSPEPSTDPTQEPSPEPSESASPSPSETASATAAPTAPGALPDTGAGDAAPVAALSAALVALGALTLAIRRRQSSGG